MTASKLASKQLLANMPFEMMKDGMSALQKLYELLEDNREKIQDLGDYIRNVVGSKKVYGIDLPMEECDSDDDCAATECNQLDMCYDGTYKDYHNVDNTCTDACGCRI